MSRRRCGRGRAQSRCRCGRRHSVDRDAGLACCRHESVAAALKLDLRPSASAQSHRMDLVRVCEAREIVLGVAERHAKAEVLARVFAASA